MESTLKNHLEHHQIHYTEYTHPAVYTVEESDKVTQHIPGLRTKNLFLKDEKGKFYLVCMPGEKRADLKSLVGRLKVKKLTFASPEELHHYLKIKPGSVSPLALIHSPLVKTIFYQEVWGAEYLGVHPNENTSTLVLSHENFMKFCSSLPNEKEVVSFA